MHSGGSEVRVTLSYAQSFTLTVADNGVGIADSMAIDGSPGHFGIRGMRERANRIRGALTIVGNLGNGTMVQLQLPGRAAYRLGKRQESKLT